MDQSGGIEAESKIDSLLDHQTQRLEDIANNSVDFIKINLLVLGAFAPFVATILSDQVPPEEILQSDFILNSTACWVVSTFISTAVYRTARSKSTSQFDTLEKAIVGNWRNADLRDEIIDNSAQYKSTIKFLIIPLSISIGFSLMAVLFLAVGMYDIIIGLPSNLMVRVFVVITLVGVITAIGAEIKNSAQAGISWVAQHEISIINGYSLRQIGASQPVDDLTEYIVKTENISLIRARLLRAIYDTVGQKSWSFPELSNELKEEYPDIGITRGMIDRLVDEEYLKKLDYEGTDTVIVHRREEAIVNSGDLDKVVGEELGRLIGHIQEDERVEKVAAEALDVSPDDIKQTLVSGTTPDRIRRLNEVIESITDELPDVEPPGKPYGKIEFRHRTTQYILTPKAIRPFSRYYLDQAANSLKTGNYIQASVIVSGALETFLRSLLKSKNPHTEVKDKSLANLINQVGKEQILDAEDSKKLEYLRSIRNKAVHDPNTNQEIGLEEVMRLKEIAEKIIHSHTDE